MFTKKDLFWSVKGLYPDVKIGKSLSEYKKVVAEYLASKFELSEDNAGLQKFVKNYTERISTLLKKFHRNFSAMVASSDHTDFFGTLITLQSFDLSPPPTKVDFGTQVERRDFQTSKATQTPQGSEWIPHSWKRPSKAGVKAATSNAATSNDLDSSGEPLAKVPRLDQVHQASANKRLMMSNCPDLKRFYTIYDFHFANYFVCIHFQKGYCTIFS